MSSELTSIRRGDPCPRCGTPLESFVGEPSMPIDVNGFIEYLAADYQLRPCGCTFRVAIERTR
jgi:hypothetical protein